MTKRTRDRITTARCSWKKRGIQKEELAFIQAVRQFIAFRRASFIERMVQDLGTLPLKIITRESQPRTSAERN